MSLDWTVKTWRCLGCRPTVALPTGHEQNGYKAVVVVAVPPSLSATRGDSCAAHYRAIGGKTRIFRVHRTARRSRRLPVQSTSYSDNVAALMSGGLRDTSAR
jgi:hypothetical protein